MASEKISLAVCGLHRQGQPLNIQLKELGSSYLRTCNSSPEYRTFVIPGQSGGLAKPGMVYVRDGSGKAFELEIWEMEVEKLGHFMMKVKRPMAIGTVMLDDGNSCLGFVAEGWVASDASTEDISHFGSWLRYMDARGSQP